MKKFSKKEFVIGACVIVALAVLIFGIDFLKGINLFKPANYYVAEYDNVGGLVSAAPVEVNGYKVGQVSEVEFPYDGQGKIKVILSLDKKLRLPANSVATIEQSLLSGAYVVIKPGNSPERLAVGANIPTGVSGNDLMSAVSNDLMPAVNKILPRVDTLLYNLNLLVADPALAASIGRLDGITGELLLTSKGLNSTINRDVPMIMRNTNGTIGNLNHVTSGLDTIAANLGELSYQLKTLPLKPTMENVESLTANLEQFSEMLNNKNSTLGKLTNDPELYNRLSRVSADVDSLILDIKKNPKRYISIKLL